MQKNPLIPFNKPYLTGNELKYISEAHKMGQLAGDGHFTKLCTNWIEKKTGCSKALLTHSCTAALEMAAILCDIQIGDEIIMPSFTFVSTANAFVVRGGVPVFVDIRKDTLNIDEFLIEKAITSRTKAIVVVHYAGASCEMDTIMKIAKQYNLLVIEDAAQGILAKYKNQSLGSIGHIGCYSFHETKNIISGEGGALLVNDPLLVKRAEIILNKGTDRNSFFRGEVDKYTWRDIGSSFLPGEIIAAFLWAQLQAAESITDRRIRIWSSYHHSLSPLFGLNKGVNCPLISNEYTHNGHIYHLLMPDVNIRREFIGKLIEKRIWSVFHYNPLHLSTGGLKFGRASGELKNTVHVADRLVRLPLWIGIEKYQSHIIKNVLNVIEKIISKQN
jgi:dTDP-4-amino-4,6-dideoxygalactose transaminase